MASCPRCSYMLVFLQRRSRYKCAKCGRLFYPKFIDDREFKQWNKKQKELDIERYGYERRKELAELKELKKSIKWLFNPPKRILRGKESKKKQHKLKLNPEERRERTLEVKRLWNKKNKEQYKAWLNKNREKKYAYLKDYRKSKLYESRLRQRLGFWRSKQKELAIQMLDKEPMLGKF